jgi:hypothetical protein
MKYENSIFKNNDDMEKLIEALALDRSSLEIEVCFMPSNILYESTLTMELTDDTKNENVQIADYHLSDLSENLGSKYIGRKFSKEFIDQINDVIQERSAK